MSDRKRSNRVRATTVRLSRWRERAQLFEAIYGAGILTHRSLAKRAAWLDQEVTALRRRLDEEHDDRHMLEAAAIQRKDRIRQELLSLRNQIDEDLHSGSLTQEEHEFARHRIAASLAQLEAPPRLGMDVRVVTIPNKKIDTEKLAQVFWMQATREARKKRGAPPPTAEEDRLSQLWWEEVKRAARDRRDL